MKLSDRNIVLKTDQAERKQTNKQKKKQNLKDQEKGIEKSQGDAHNLAALNKESVKEKIFLIVSQSERATVAQ